MNNSYRIILYPGRLFLLNPTRTMQLNFRQRCITVVQAGVVKLDSKEQHTLATNIVLVKHATDTK